MKATQVTGPRWPLSVALSLPVRADHIRIFPSTHAVAIVSSSKTDEFAARLLGNSAAERTPEGCFGNSWTCLSVLTSQIRTDRSRLAVIRRLPSDVNTAEVTAAWCPYRLLRDGSHNERQYPHSK